MEKELRQRTSLVARLFSFQEASLMGILARFALTISAAAALLAACGGSQPPIGAPGALPQSPTSAIATHAERGASWMLPEAKSDDLLYVTNYSNVMVLTYPQGKLVGILNGFVSAAGECVDTKGDVFVTNFKPVTLYEYAHGGKKPIAKFPTTKAGTTGCAVNPVNGDLAITGLTSYVEIFKGAKGKPIVLRDKGMGFGQFCTYDEKGDLFFVGLATDFKKQRLSELLSGSNRFVPITLNARIDPEASIQWNGSYLTALSYVPFGHGKPVIFQFLVHNMHGTKVGTTSLNGTADIIGQYFINAKAVVVPNVYTSDSEGYSNVLLYDYPAGGNPFMTITKKHLGDARGAVVTPAAVSKNY
jgi:hypothetical protein